MSQLYFQHELNKIQYSLGSIPATQACTSAEGRKLISIFLYSIQKKETIRIETLPESSTKMGRSTNIQLIMYEIVNT